MGESIYINSQGGLGFNLALSHIVKELKTKYEKVCILSPYYDVFEATEGVDGVYKPNELRDFIFDARKEHARLICERMYDSQAFIYKEVSYADAWRIAAGLELHNNSSGSDTKAEYGRLLETYPQLNRLKQQVLEEVKKQGFEDFVIVQFTGGQSPLVQVPREQRDGKVVEAWDKVPYNYEQEPLKRHYPIQKASAFVELFRTAHPQTGVIAYQLPNEPTPDCLHFSMPYLVYYLLAADPMCRGTISIDSSLQHLVAGACKSVVLWGHSLPDSFGYEYNRNIVQECRRDDILYFSALGPSGARIDYIQPQELLKQVDEYLFADA